MAAPEYPALHQVAHRPARCLLESHPQVFVVGVPVEVGRQVATDPVAEDILAQELLQHPDDGRTLLVGEQVEHGLCVGRGDHRVLDGSCGG